MEKVIAYVFASTLQIVGLVVGTLVFAWVPMLAFGIAHHIDELNWVPAPGFIATWVLLVLAASFVWTMNTGMKLVSVDIDKLLRT